MATITPELAREWFDYDPVTGWLTWKRAPRAKAKLGSRAGGVSGVYRALRVRGTYTREHIVVWSWMTGASPKEDIDHRNRNKLDNRWENLREATSAQNAANTKPRGKLKAKGVVLTGNGTYAAYIKIKGKSHNLGTFETLWAASAAYQAMAKIEQGQFFYEGSA
jgi:hypothetical protein